MKPTLTKDTILTTLSVIALATPATISLAQGAVETAEGEPSVAVTEIPTEARRLLADGEGGGEGGCGEGSCG